MASRASQRRKVLPRDGGENMRRVWIAGATVIHHYPFLPRAAQGLHCDRQYLQDATRSAPPLTQPGGCTWIAGLHP
jgi:hypothetical protein